MDNNETYLSAEFYALGLGDPQCISAATGSGTGDLLDLVLSLFPKESVALPDEEIPRFAVVGRPNAGKSSLINAFIGEERNIVTDIAGIKGKFLTASRSASFPTNSGNGFKRFYDPMPPSKITKGKWKRLCP